MWGWGWVWVWVWVWVWFDGVWVWVWVWVWVGVGTSLAGESVVSLDAADLHGVHQHTGQPETDRKRGRREEGEGGVRGREG